MKINSARSLPLILLTTGLLALPHGQVAAQTEQEIIDAARTVIKADREVVVAETLQLSDEEARGFYPIYKKYRAEMDKVSDGFLKLVQEYASFYPDVPEDRSKTMLKELGDLEEQQLATRTSYLKKFGKVLPAVKNLRFAQVENRLDLVLRLKLAVSIPLAPIGGNDRMAPSVSGVAMYVEGVPGGYRSQTVEVKATVKGISSASRKVTFVSADGVEKTVKAGPNVINFDQIRVGDQIKITLTQEIVVQMAGKGTMPNDATAVVVAGAPKGDKPGGLIAEATQVTATVKAIDPEKRTATLQYEDGSTRTFAVRGDLDLTKRQIGEQVVIRVTEMLAVSIEKP